MTRGDSGRWTLTVAACLVATVGLACGPAEEAAPPSGVRVLSQPAAKRAGPPLPDPTLWERALEDEELEAGRVVWTGTCIQCHSTGLGGAPLIGNAELWSPRIAKGEAILIEHAQGGFFGDVGEMPARGGNADLSDDEVAAAVRFMVSRVGS